MDTKKLRQKILDLAIHGKLVPQDPNDEPASVLLERIRAEKERLITEGKIKRSKKSATSDTSHYENVPFEVPESWCWIRLADIASFGGGKTPSMENKEYWDNGTHLWVTSKDMKSNVINDSMMKISDEAIKIMQVYQPGTLLMVTRSGILRRMLPLAILGKEATVNQDLKTISIVAPVLPCYIFYAILANESMILKDYHKDGTTVDSINFDKFVEMLIPLPPTCEQQRIIDAIETYLSLVEEIKVSENDILGSIDSARSKILDLAIHGKLIPQDANDEPASVLLKRINPKAVASCDNPHYENVPFELPKGWCWCRLDKLCDIKGGKRVPRGMSFSDVPTSHVYIRVTNMKKNTIIDNELKYIDDEVFSYISNYTISKSDLYLTIAGTIGDVGEVPDKYDMMNLTENAAKLTNIICDRKYLMYSLLSSQVQEHFSSKFHQVAQPKLSIETASSTFVPIPPMEEQKRIVIKIQELYATIDSITDTLR